MFCVTLIQGQDQIMYFIVNASPTKPLDIAASNLKVHRSHDV